MATPTKSKPSQTNITDLFQQEEELRKQLENIRQQKLELIRKQADEIKDQVLVKLTEVAKMLSPKEPKPVQVNEELQELVIGYLKSKPNGAGIDEISAGIKDAAGQPRWKVPSLRPQLPLLVSSGKIKVKPDAYSLIFPDNSIVEILELILVNDNDYMVSSILMCKTEDDVWSNQTQLTTKQIDDVN